MHFAALEPRCLFSNAVSFGGVDFSWNSKGVLRLFGSDASVHMNVTETTVRNAVEQSLQNRFNEPDDGYDYCRVFCLNTVSGFEQLGFLESTTYEDAEPPVAMFLCNFEKVTYIKADNGLNILLPTEAVTRVYISLGGGDDVVAVGKMNRPRVQISGGDGDDFIVSSARKTAISGNGGNDTIVSTRGIQPTLSGGAGRDQLFCSKSIVDTAFIDGGTGRDRSDVLGMRVEMLVLP